MPAVTPRLRLTGVAPPGGTPIDLVVEAGELVALSGWDSSDLLRIAAGLDRPASGRVAVDDRPVSDRASCVELGVVLVPQSGALALLLTAYENVLMPLIGAPARADADGGGGAEPVLAARQALEQVGLADSADHLVEELSGGQQQRVAIARALAARPRLLLGDQVTTDLDPANRARMLGLLRGLASGGAAVLLASDDPAVLEACDRTMSV